MVDSRFKAYTGDKCTYNLRRIMNRRKTIADWNKFAPSRAKFYDASFPHDSRMLYWAGNVASPKGNTSSTIVKWRKKVVGFKPIS
jgi:hypothetical protein